MSFNLHFQMILSMPTQKQKMEIDYYATLGWKVRILVGHNEANLFMNLHSIIHNFPIRISNEGLCAKTGPINLHQLLVTRVLAREHWFVYQNRSERHLLVFWRNSVLIALNRKHQGYALKIENCRWYDVYTIPFAMSMQVASRPALPQFNVFL